MSGFATSVVRQQDCTSASPGSTSITVGFVRGKWTTGKNKGGNMIQKIEIVRGRGGWFFRLVSKNGRTLCHSEMYKTIQGARKTARKIQADLYGVGIEEV